MVDLPNDWSKNLIDARNPETDNQALIFSTNDVYARKASNTTPEIAVQTTHTTPSVGRIGNRTYDSTETGFDFRYPYKTNSNVGGFK